MAEARERGACVAVVADRVSLPAGNVVSGAGGKEADDDVVLRGGALRLLPPMMLRRKPRSPPSRSTSVLKSEDADDVGRMSNEAACEMTESLFHA